MQSKQQLYEEGGWDRGAWELPLMGNCSLLPSNNEFPYSGSGPAKLVCSGLGLKSGQRDLIKQNQALACSRADSVLSLCWPALAPSLPLSTCHCLVSKAAALVLPSWGGSPSTCPPSSLSAPRHWSLALLGSAIQAAAAGRPRRLTAEVRPAGPSLHGLSGFQPRHPQHDLLYLIV